MLRLWSNFNALQWRHNGCDSVSNHQPHHKISGLFRRRSKKTSKLHVTGLCAGKSSGPVNSPHKWPVTRKMSPFDDVIMGSLAKSSVAGLLHPTVFYMLLLIHALIAIPVYIVSLGKRRSDHIPDSEIHGANMGPTWVLPAQDRSHVGPMNLAIRDTTLRYPCNSWAPRHDWDAYRNKQGKYTIPKIHCPASWSITLNKKIILQHHFFLLIR